MDVTAKIVRFVIDIDLDRVPARALANARIAVRDCLGVALAGSAEPSARICAAVARQETAREEATVIGQGFRSSALQAAFVNGTAAHALDFDHSLALMGQPTAPIIPAAFTLADSSNASGRRFLEAMIAGFEVTAKLVYSLRDASESGWHAPGILGLLGAAAASAKLSGLGPEQIETALGIGASMAGGVAANFGTMTKPLHVGLAARSGLLAGKLAAAGFSAGRRAIESGSGLYEMFYKGAVVNEQPIQELGTIYSLEADGVRIKPYPCGGLTHPVVDAVLALRTEHRITADLIESILVEVTRHTHGRIAFRVPQTGLQGKFCMGYIVARAIVDGRISLDHFTDDAVRDTDVLELANKVEMRIDANLRASNAAGRPCRVTIRLKNGSSYVREAEHARGSPEAPMTEAELEAKFSDCARRVIDEPSVTRALDYLARLEALETIGPLARLVAGAEGGAGRS